MLGHHYPNVEKSQLVSYVEDYLECVESMPLDIQRNVSLLREIDSKYQGIVFPLVVLVLRFASLTIQLPKLGVLDWQIPDPL